ncbi:MAG: TonB-dependent receptor, partial [Pseudomonadota bacterium]
MPTFRARLLCATSLFALNSFATLTFAQTADEDTTFLGTLIFGELLTRTTQDSPTSAIVETGEDLEERGDVDLYNAIERAPNVSTTFGNKGFVLRGIQANGAVSNVQLNGTLVSVQVDGVALNNYQSTFFGPYSTWDLDQYEILRGPQSTQQGRNALAGAIIIETRDPAFFPEYRLRVEGGSRDTQRLALALNQPLGDTVAVRVTGETKATDGYVTSRPLDDDEYDAREYEAYRAKLRWQPSENFDSVIEYSFTDSSGGEDYVLDSEFPDQRVTDQTADAFEGSVHQSLGFSTTYQISAGLTLETETSFYEQDYERVEGFALPLGAGESLIEIDGGSETFEQDIQLKFESGRYQGVVGLFYTETSDRRPVFSTFDLGGLNPMLAGVSDTVDDQFDTEVTNIAIYGETDVDIGSIASGFTITAGVRLDAEEFTYTQAVDFGPTLNTVAMIPDVPENSDSEQFRAFLPKLGVTYDFTEDQAVSATVQRGYRAGGVSSNFVTAELSEYDPEFATNYEVAYRGSFQNDRVRIAGNVFFTQWEDMQISVPGTPTGTALDPLFNFDTANAAESELYGFELSVEADPSDRLSVFGSVGYTQTEFI